MLDFCVDCGLDGIPRYDEDTLCDSCWDQREDARIDLYLNSLEDAL